MTADSRLGTQATMSRRQLTQGLAALAGSGLAAPALAQTSILPPAGDALEALRQATAALLWGAPTTAEAGWMEWLLPAPGAWQPLVDNPFDPAQVDLVAEFTGPQGQRIRRPVFWRKDARAQGWCLRWLPPVAGAWTLQTQVRLRGSEPLALGQPVRVDVARVPARQVLRTDREQPAHFAWNDGTPYTPVGLNVAWGSGGSPLPDYRRWFKRLSDNGGNFARVWMASWCFSIEWKDTGLGDYSRRMDRAAQLDEVFALAEKQGIGLMLCLLNHGAFNDRTDAEWKDNPYNAANGGPCRSPAEFVTHPVARQLFARRLRYIVARWAASPALFCWEWWNEINWTPIDDASLMPWVREMDAVLDAWDPHRRLRSTSGHEAHSKVWHLPAMDIVQHHDYTSDELNLYYQLKHREHRGAVPGKPLLPGELGMGTSFDPKNRPPYNWEILHLHNGLWASLFNGYAGTGMYWWWDQMVDPQKLWGSYLGVARYLAAVNAQPAHRLAVHRPHPVRVSSAETEVEREPLALALAGPASVLLWVRDAAHDPTRQRELYLEAGAPATWTPRWQRQQGVGLSLAGLALADGAVSVRWMDSHSGQWLGEPQTARVQGGALTLAVPPFERGAAALVTRG